MRDLVALYASGDLDEKGCARVEAHLATCDACRRAVADMRGVVAVASAARISAPDDLAARIAERVSRIPAPAPGARRSFRWSLALGYGSVAVIVFAAGVLIGTQLPKMQSYISRVAQPPPESVARVPPATSPQPPAPANPQQIARAPQVARSSDRYRGPEDLAVEPAPPSSASSLTAAPQSAPAEAPSSSAATSPAGPPPLQAPMPVGDDDMRLASLPQPDAAGSGALAVARPGESPSRGGARWGVIRGRVTYDDAGVAGISLRLVRADDSSFVAGALAETDNDGAYELRGVRPGVYRIYAYTGDNPLYFNQCSRPIRVTRRDAAIADLRLVMVLEPLEPQLDQTVNRGGVASFRWRACPGADHYELSVSDEESHAEVLTMRTAQPAATAAASAFAGGRPYRWRVRAVGADGSVIGASPGAGGAPWTFRVQ
jgi:hypothetical protein